VIGALIFAAVVNLASTRKGSTTAGPDLYIVGQARSLAGTVSRTGPLLLQDLLGNSRDIYVQHLTGDDWRTFEAHAPGAPRRCVLRWEPGARQFTDPCDRRVYPADGTGLTTFPTRVDPDGRVMVDLRQPQVPTATTATTSPPVSPPPS
ncbi:MAG: hypothetical protein M3Z84_10440, partial [Actinomycetota bacterium]|nr:hypothetical protein [Actinomycetota bacterium]